VKLIFYVLSISIVSATLSFASSKVLDAWLFPKRHDNDQLHSHQLSRQNNTTLARMPAMHIVTLGVDHLCFDRGAVGDLVQG